MKNYEKQMFEFIDQVNKTYSTGDKRQMVLLLGVYGEYVINELLKTKLIDSGLNEINSQEIKLKILKATGILSSDEFSVFRLLNQIRNNYAHNLEIDEQKMESLMKQIKINWDVDEKKIKELEEQFNKIPFTKFQSGCIAKIIFSFQRLGGFLPKK